MKKTLLCLLFLLFSTLFYAQITPLSGCQTYPLFNLTVKNTELIGNLNPNETTVSYHLSLNDANTNTSPILNPTAFDSPQAKTIYARINNKGSITTNFFQLIFYPTVQILDLKMDPTCQEPRTRITLVSVLPGASQNFSYSLDYGQTYLPNRDFYLEPGNYTILVKDSYNCKTDNPVFIQVTPYIPLVANAMVTEGVNCGDKDSVTITATGGQGGGYTYSFDGINFSNENTRNNLPAGKHTVYVKDQFGCISNTSVTVNQYKSTLTSIVTIKTITCQNSKGSITVQGLGGKSPYQYSLNSENYQQNNTFNNLVEGHYFINTKDALGCISSFNAVIFPYSQLMATTTLTNVSCNGQKDGSIEVNATGGSGTFLYALRNVSGILLSDFQSKNIFNNIPKGSYSVEIIDDAGCIVSMFAEIQEPAVLVSTSKIEKQNVTITTTGGSGKYQYSLDQSGDFKSDNIFTNVSFGDHQISVKDENGCLNILNIYVNPPAPLLDGKTVLNFLFKLGQTLGDLILEGQNIKWYSTSGSLSGKSSKSAEATLPPTTVLVDGTTYYASQTIDGIESKERLAVTVKVNGSLSTDDFVLPNFKYFPNPVQHLLSINNPSNIDSVEVISASGKVVLTKKINDTNSEIDLSGLSSGIYFLKVKSEGQIKTVKIIKK